MEINFRMDQFNKEVLEGNATWWQMDLPSGKVIFGEAKAKMLGYPDSKFTKYQDFTKLLHPDDYENAMKAMNEHISGKNKFYETKYRIKNKKGEYLTFYDCGQIVKRDGKDLTIIGFVMKIKEDIDILTHMNSFKDLILNGTPSIVGLVAGIKNKI